MPYPVLCSIVHWTTEFPDAWMIQTPLPALLLIRSNWIMLPTLSAPSTQIPPMALSTIRSPASLNAPPILLSIAPPTRITPKPPLPSGNEPVASVPM